MLKTKQKNEPIAYSYKILYEDLQCSFKLCVKFSAAQIFASHYFTAWTCFKKLL